VEQCTAAEKIRGVLMLNHKCWPVWLFL